LQVGDHDHADDDGQQLRPSRGGQRLRANSDCACNAHFFLPNFYLFLRPVFSGRLHNGHDLTVVHTDLTENKLAPRKLASIAIQFYVHKPTTHNPGFSPHRNAEEVADTLPHLNTSIIARDLFLFLATSDRKPVQVEKRSDPAEPLRLLRKRYCRAAQIMARSDGGRSS
jgi:hypothetical protein